MKSLLFLIALIISGLSTLAQIIEQTPATELDKKQFLEMLKTLKTTPSNNMAFSGHGDVAMINMQKPVFLFENNEGKVYKHPMDGMRYLDPKNNAKMPTLLSYQGENSRLRLLPGQRLFKPEPGELDKQ